MWTRLTILIFLYIGLSFLALDVCTARTDCTLISSLRASLDDIKNDFLTHEDRVEINEIFDRDSLSNKEKARLAFETFLEARLRKVDPTLSFEIRKAYKELVIKHTSGPLKAHYDLKTGKVIAEIPEFYADSLVSYAIIAHELEHKLQNLRIDSEGLSHFKLAFQKFVYKVDERFLKESGAMRAEWIYISSTPESVRVKIAQEILKNPNIENSEKSIILIMLLGADEKIDDYLALQHAVGRYSKESIKKYFRAQTTDKVVLGLAGIATALSVATTVCIHAIDKEGHLPSGLFFEIICAHNPVVKAAMSNK